MKDGRPFSNENGDEDSKLITDLNNEYNRNTDTYRDCEKEVSEWINAHIKPSKRIYPYVTSYGLKHMLDHDINIYLTNNQFKDAMLLAGFYPVDENELNWKYRITLIED
jgi:hypothetical protein